MWSLGNSLFPVVAACPMKLLTYRKSTPFVPQFRKFGPFFQDDCRKQTKFKTHSWRLWHCGHGPANRISRKSSVTFAFVSPFADHFEIHPQIPRLIKILWNLKYESKQYCFKSKSTKDTRTFHHKRKIWWRMKFCFTVNKKRRLASIISAALLRQSRKYRPLESHLDGGLRKVRWREKNRSWWRRRRKIGLRVTNWQWLRHRAVTWININHKNGWRKYYFHTSWSVRRRPQLDDTMRRNPITSACPPRERSSDFRSEMNTTRGRRRRGFVQRCIFDEFTWEKENNTPHVTRKFL